MVGAISGVSAETLGPVTDPLGVVKIAKGASVHIGGYWTLSGPDVDIGLDQKRGAEIALVDWGNAVAGHPVESISWSADRRSTSAPHNNRGADTVRRDLPGLKSAA